MWSRVENILYRSIYGLNYCLNNSDVPAMDNGPLKPTVMLGNIDSHGEKHVYGSASKTSFFLAALAF